MKQFIVDRHTTPNTPTLEQVPTEKIPIYENRAAVEADLANLTEGQIVATVDTGDELAQPVDVVESGNLHAVTSNAVAESLEWKEIGAVTGKTEIDCNFSLYREIMIIGSFPQNNYVMSIIIPTAYINKYSGTENNYVTGIGGRLNSSAPNGARAQWTVADNKIKLNTMLYDNADSYSNFQTVVYAR